MADNKRYIATRDVWIGGKARKAGSTFTATDDEVARAIIKGYVEPAASER